MMIQLKQGLKLVAKSRKDALLWRLNDDSIKTRIETISRNRNILI